jgi:hypothetical protein
MKHFKYPGFVVALFFATVLLVVAIIAFFSYSV